MADRYECRSPLSQPSEWVTHERAQTHWSPGIDDPYDSEEEAPHHFHVRKSGVFTVADLVVLIDSLPEVDDEFFDDIESLNRNQPKLSALNWER